MKHLKLYEQFDEEEAWWDEESPFDQIKDLKIVKHGENDFYLAKMIDGKNVRLYDDNRYDYKISIFDTHPIYFDDTRITILYNHEKSLLKDLPKELKDRIDLSEKSYH